MLSYLAALLHTSSDVTVCKYKGVRRVFRICSETLCYRFFTLLFQPHKLLQLSPRVDSILSRISRAPVRIILVAIMMMFLNISSAAIAQVSLLTDVVPSRSSDLNKPDSKQLQGLYEQQLARINTLTASVAESMSESIGEGPIEFLQSIEYAVVLDVETGRIRVLSSPEADKSASPEASKSARNEILASQGKFLNVTTPAEALSDSDNSEKQEVDHGQSGIKVDKPMQFVTANLDNSVNDWQIVLRKTSCASVLGYLPFGERGKYIFIPDLLRSAQLSVHEERIDDSSIFVLVAKSGITSLELWLDPAVDYSVRRLVFRQAEGSVGPLDVESCTVTMREFRRINGCFFPLALEVSQVRPGGDKILPPSPTEFGSRGETTVVLPRRVTNTSVEFHDVEVNPVLSDSSFSINSPIADGTVVRRLDAPYLPHVWKDNEIVPDFNNSLVFKDEGFSAGESASRFFWLIFANVSLFSVFVGYVLLRRYVSRKSD